MSFELKPQKRINETTKSVDEIVWTFSRSPVPPLLVGRVSNSTWTHTFDIVRGHYDEHINAIRPKSISFFGLCIVPCGITRRIKVATDYQDGWIEILKNQQEIYHHLGVQVSLAKEAYSIYSVSDWSFSNEIVGLRFRLGPESDAVVDNVVPNSTHVTTSGMSSNSKPSPTSPSSSSIKERLRKLESIKHMLTDQEYTDKRKQILADM